MNVYSQYNLCTYCGDSFFHTGIDVGKYWNNQRGTAYVCSDECHSHVKSDHKNYLYWRRKLNDN